MEDVFSSCTLCESADVIEFSTEMVVHFSGLKGLNKSPIFTFPKLFFCPNCRSVRCNLSVTELQQLKDSVADVEEATR